ncbi:CsbD family protein [Streptomyces mirabilis]|uniref:CsbD family protein n=1 Tax=Streptomyces mirabilis TaxID=68239 RepID=UPI00332DF009
MAKAKGKGNAKVHQITGKMKETLGKALGDSSMQQAGRGEQLRAKAHEMTEKATDHLRKRSGH